MFSAVLAIIVLLRILFLIGEIGNTLIMTGDNPPIHKTTFEGRTNNLCGV